MKIYNEIVMDMNPESSDYGKTISEDSYEYNGDVALCGSWGGHRPQPNPLHWAYGQEGHKSPTQISGITSGIAGIPSWLSGQSFAPEHSFYEQKIPKAQTKGQTWHRGPIVKGLSDILGGAPQFWSTKALGTEWERMTGYGRQQDPSHQAYSKPYHKTYKYGQYGAPRWAESWYKPYYETMVQNPLKEVRDVDSPHAMFTTAEDAGITQDMLNMITEAGGSIDSSVASELLGEDTPLIAKEGSADIGFATGDFATEKTGLEGQIKDVEDLEAIAVKEKEVGLSDIKKERLAAAHPDLAVSASEQARAAQAATGMAYSAPAERVGEVAGTQREQEMLGYKKGERDIIRGHKTQMEAYGKEKDRLTGEIQVAAQGLAEDLFNVFTETAATAQGIVDFGTGLVGAHREFGKSSASKAGKYGKIVGSERYGTSPTGEGFWDEQDIEEAVDLERLATESEVFATQLAGGAEDWYNTLTAEITGG